MPFDLDYKNFPYTFFLHPKINVKSILPLIVGILSMTPVYGQAIENDHFSKAVALSSKVPVYIRGTLATNTRDSLATRQEGEPRHAGKSGFGSVWYSWTPKSSGRVQVSSNSDRVGIILAIYTGESVRDLKLVQRYNDFAYPAFSRRRSEPFTNAARVEFEAKAGETYFFAIDSENRVLDTFDIRIKTSPNPLEPELELIKAGSKWDYLLATTRDGLPFDPETLDKDFDTTWHNPEKYDGPAFRKSGKMPIGYGGIASGKIRTNAGGKKDYLPESGRRYTMYLRKKFTPPMKITDLGIEGIFDDGAIIYLDGKEVARINVAADKDPHSWKTLAKTARFPNNGNTERTLQYALIRGLNLPADQPVTLSMSLHNAQANSSDLGVDLRVYAIQPKAK